MDKFRYAILAAVSTKAQAAADRISLPDQIRQCRSAAAERGWVETAGPFEIPGASRTKYVNLSDAERAIPPLRMMLDAAQRHEFDILVLYHLNRLRDLLDQVYRSLGVYRVQIYSVTQPVEPVDPEKYNYVNSDTMRIVVTMSQMTSQAETSDIRKRYNAGMPARVINKGLPATSPPYGYIMGRNRKTPPEIVPELARILIEIKDMLLIGASTRDIAKSLQERNIPAPKGNTWHGNTIGRILANPFYAGYVVWGVTRVQRDLREGTMTRKRVRDPKKVAIVRGKHEPLWDDETRDLIKMTLASRMKNKRGKINNPFSSLLVCGVCGARLWRSASGPRVEGLRLVWKCSMNSRHLLFPDGIAYKMIISKLQTELRSYSQKKIVMQQFDPVDISKDLMEYKEQRKRLEDAYQIGAITLEALIDRAAGIDAEISKLEHMEIDIKNAQRDRESWLETMGGMEKMIDSLDDFIRNEEGPKVNKALRNLISHIIVSPEFHLEIVFK